jgi:hypothetical protein
VAELTEVFASLSNTRLRDVALNEGPTSPAESEARDGLFPAVYAGGAGRSDRIGA